MSKAGFIEFFERDLTALEKEITAYSDERNLWITSKHIKNSAGNLCLHVIGNLPFSEKRDISGIGIKNFPYRMYRERN